VAAAEATIQDTITAFVVHLYRHAQSLTEPVDTEAAEAEALGLLERTFPDAGGYRMARAEALQPTRGGLRFVLDKMTERFKADRRHIYVNRVLTEALRVRSWPERVQFVRAVLDQVAPTLPGDVDTVRVPEEFANDCEEIARVYVESLDRVGQLIRGK